MADNAPFGAYPRYATDASGNVTGFTIGNGLQYPLSFPGRRRAAYMATSTLDAITSVTSDSILERFILPAPFSRVRIHLVNVDTAAASGTYRIVAAVSEIAPTTPAADIWQPVVGGVNQTALRAGVGSPGWAEVLFAGANTKQIDIAADAWNPTIASSDWLDMRSIDRTDGGLGNILLIRYECLGGGSRSGESGLSAATLPKKSWDVAGTDAKAWHFEHSGYKKSGASAVTDLTLYGTGTRQPISLAMIIEAEYDIPAYTVLAHGDSIVAMNDGNIALYEFSQWPQRGCLLASSSTAVFRAVIAAKGGSTYPEFSQSGLTTLAAIRPAYFLHQIWSSNEGVPDATTEGIAISHLHNALDAANAVGARLIAWGQGPNNNYDASADAYRLALRARVKTMAASTRAFDYFDVEFLSDGATPARYISGLNADNTHPNEAGTELLGTRFAAFLANLV